MEPVHIKEEVIEEECFDSSVPTEMLPVQGEGGPPEPGSHPAGLKRDPTEHDSANFAEDVTELGSVQVIEEIPELGSDLYKEEDSDDMSTDDDEDDDTVSFLMHSPQVEAGPVQIRHLTEDLDRSVSSTAAIAALIADQDCTCFQCKRPVTGKQCSQKGAKKRGRSKYVDMLLGAQSANTRQPSLASQELTLPSEGAKIQNLRSARLSHSCRECGKRFGRLDTLTLHQLVHKVESMHDCTACGKSLEKGTLKKTKKKKTPVQLSKGGRGPVH
ncbi:zinc finger protein 530-like [Polyodon spathula]|uniref:zinc finger protein 530-like n=1 Tax=Polyodon spathula TaxID=7913 RepID=UPI001B7EFF98|nr:zinc finger protein 530-like [Polyodon spathula]XP_041098390.1 zinc finger protein 530-like [Polyodon spathula]XP_041098391.1 zinc finger protein 530-like [Polyodon spathula]